MNGDVIIIISFVVYFAAMIGIGLYFYNKSKNMSDYFLGGRQLGSWVTALSAQASDMSGWLLMGLPAAAYISGLSASWIAIGLFIGTFLNWTFVASRLRKFTAVSGDSITIPQYLQNRFLSNSAAIRVVCAVIIFVFFLIYTASGFSAGAKLFQHVFGIDYVVALTIGAIIVISYTFMGGFSAVCWTDFIQGFLMLGAIVVIPILAALNTPNLSIDMLQSLKDNTFLSMLSASPGGKLSFVAIISSLSWALGYFGMPHILTRFMAIKSSKLIKKSRTIAITWAVISLCAAILVGIIGYTYLTSIGVNYASLSGSEVIFMDLVLRLTPPLLTGILLSAILAAIMSTADSQLLVAASAVSNDFYKVFKKNASNKELMWVSRIAVLAIAAIAYIIAFDPESSVMGLVSYAWAGFGAAFGPSIILSLFWKRMTIHGAVAGMSVGGIVVLLWETLQLQAHMGLYSIVPGFITGFIVILVVSLLGKQPSKEVFALFEKAKTSNE